MMGRKILIYGSIGSGKTTLSREIFNDFPLIELDEINRNLIVPGNSGYLELKKIISTEYFEPNGQINKKKLKVDLFNNNKLREKIENILHPLIFDELNKSIKGKNSYVVISPLVKTMLQKIKFDLKIKVVCNTNLQIKRVESRDNLKKNITKKIIAYQENNYESIQPDFIFDSAGNLDEQLIKLKKIL
jgi:dephospho-CoA kinase